MTDTEVRQIMEDSLGDCATCLEKSPTPVARQQIRLHITIDSTGRVREVKRLDSDSSFDRLEKCVRDIVKQRRFPANPTASETTVEMELLFDPTRS